MIELMWIWISNRLRRKRNKSKKYGLITGRGADYEMAPLDADDDDDDEDTTVFEMNRRKKWISSNWGDINQLMFILATIV